MRRVFTSPRLENVEGVAALLREHEIEVKITNGRTFRGAIRGNFSYREPADAGEQPAVWVVYSDDQPKARELLREAGLLDSGRSPTSYLPTPTVHQLRGEDGAAEDAAKRRAFRIRVALFVGIAIALGMSLLSFRKPATPGAPATSAPASAAPARSASASAAPKAPAAAPTYVIATPRALAALLVEAEIEAQSTAHPIERLCLALDGETPSAERLAAIRLPKGLIARPAKECADDAMRAGVLSIAVGEYRTDGSGAGTIRLELIDVGKDGRPRSETRTLAVKREGEAWRVLRVVQ
ncbi:MAG: hypothetical protein KA144_03105 [Xanthomonadaceae bacterium]|nr:hypothetical protein [Xanthomonadaceae bacterium]